MKLSFFKGAFAFYWLIFFLNLSSNSTFGQCYIGERVSLSTAKKSLHWIETYQNCDSIFGFIDLWVEPGDSLNKDFFDNFVYIEQLVIREDEYFSFSNLKGIKSLAIINDCEELPSFPKLTTIHNNLLIHSNDDIFELKGFNDVKYVDTLWINGNYNLKKIDGFNGLIEVGWLAIYSNSNLKEIYGFNSLIKANRILIKKNQLLENVWGFQNLKTIEDALEIPSFETFEAPSFENLKSVKIKEIKDNRSESEKIWQPVDSAFQSIFFQPIESEIEMTKTVLRIIFDFLGLSQKPK